MSVEITISLKFSSEENSDSYMTKITSHLDLTEYRVEKVMKEKRETEEKMKRLVDLNDEVIKELKEIKSRLKKEDDLSKADCFNKLEVLALKSDFFDLPNKTLGKVFRDMSLYAGRSPRENESDGEITDMYDDM